MSPWIVSIWLSFRQSLALSSSILVCFTILLFLLSLNAYFRDAVEEAFFFFEKRELERKKSIFFILNNYKKCSKLKCVAFFAKC